MNLESTEIQSRVQKLCDSIYSFQIDTDSKKLHFFGSRVYGLATNTTNIDIYLEIGKTKQLTIIIFRLQSIFSIFFVFIKYKHTVKINVDIG